MRARLGCFCRRLFRRCRDHASDFGRSVEEKRGVSERPRRDGSPQREERTYRTRPGISRQQDGRNQRVQIEKLSKRPLDAANNRKAPPCFAAAAGDRSEKPSSSKLPVYLGSSFK